jgi:hypothetical protein
MRISAPIEWIAFATIAYLAAVYAILYGIRRAMRRERGER